MIKIFTQCGFLLDQTAKAKQIQNIWREPSDKHLNRKQHQTEIQIIFCSFLFRYILKILLVTSADFKLHFINIFVPFCCFALRVVTEVWRRSVFNFNSGVTHVSHQIVEFRTLIKKIKTATLRFTSTISKQPLWQQNQGFLTTKFSWSFPATMVVRQGIPS